MSSQNTQNVLSEDEKRQRYKILRRTAENMVHYPDFVDKDIKRKMVGSISSWDIRIVIECINRIMPTNLRLPRPINYDNNILFICNEEIMNEVFFLAFLKLPELVDFRCVDIMKIQDLWYGRLNKNNYFMDYDPEEIHSFEDLKDDVLCFYVTPDMLEVGKTPEILTTMMSARKGKKGRKINNQNTWIYYQGTIDELRDSRFSLWESFFKRNGLIIDLNPQENQNDFVSADIYSPF